MGAWLAGSVEDQPAQYVAAAQLVKCFVGFFQRAPIGDDRLQTAAGHEAGNFAQVTSGPATGPNDFQFILGHPFCH